MLWVAGFVLSLASVKTLPIVADREVKQQWAFYSTQLSKLTLYKVYMNLHFGGLIHRTPEVISLWLF
jgi:hypothetical protein